MQRHDVVSMVATWLVSQTMQRAEIACQELHVEDTEACQLTLSRTLLSITTETER